MKKKEIIWREILTQVLEKKKRQFTQKDLAEKFKVSLSTVFNALKVPRLSKAITVTGRYFTVRDPEKLLLLWGTFRNLEKDTVYKTHFKGDIFEAEGLMPAGIIFGAYSAYKKKFKDVPADYDKVYIYSSDLKEIKKRFPLTKGYENLIVLTPDPFLKNYGEITPLPQMFVDLWNLPEWYAKDFYLALKEKLHGILA